MIQKLFSSLMNTGVLPRRKVQPCAEAAKYLDLEKQMVKKYENDEQKT